MVKTINSYVKRYLKTILWLIKLLFSTEESLEILTAFYFVIFGKSTFYVIE